ncbi:Aldo/keto reductase [Mycena floridula]|nr:Aldo/keto reductase [Mycena floridula]
MATAPKIALSSTVSIPLVGLGTWQSSPEEVQGAILAALQVGYRHIDCAWGYGNEKDVGIALKKFLDENPSVKRSDIFITSKLWGTYHNRVEQAIDETLGNLGLDYLDLYLVHWPVALNPNGNSPMIPTLPNGQRDIVKDWKLSDTWAGMEAVLAKGKAKSIGVSNFSELNLGKILPTATVKPAVNQLELHPYNPQHKLLAYLKEQGIRPEAYSPLGSTGSPLLKDDVILKIAKERNLSPADVLLGWAVAKEIIVLPKSVSRARIEANFVGALKAAGKYDDKSGSTALTAEDIAELDGLAADGKQKRFIMPPWPVELGFDNWTNKVPLV